MAHRQQGQAIVELALGMGALMLILAGLVAVSTVTAIELASWPWRRRRPILPHWPRHRSMRRNSDMLEGCLLVRATRSAMAPWQWKWMLASLAREARSRPRRPTRSMDGICFFSGWAVLP